eukprot:Gb_06723 [translate_table: standard]
MHTGNFRLQGYADSDWVGCIDSRKSTSGYCFSLDSIAVSWSNKKQPNVALSSTEAEYKAAVTTACEAIWLKRILADIGLHREEAIKLFCDNQSVLKIAKNPVFHTRTKHIEVHHHFIREQIQRGEIELVYRLTNDQLADVFTKPLAHDKFKYFRNGLGVKSNGVNIKGECWNI